MGLDTQTGPQKVHFVTNAWLPGYAMGPQSFCNYGVWCLFQLMGDFLGFFFIIQPLLNKISPDPRIR